MKQVVRPAVATDLPRLMGMDHSCISEYVWQLSLERGEGPQVVATFRQVRLPRAVRVEYPRDVYALADEWQGQTGFFVAVVEDEPVGYLRAVEHPPADLAWIVDLAVAPPVRRHGIATALVQTARDWAMASGYRQLILEMTSKSHPAISLAQKLGFEFCGYNDHYYTRDIALFFGQVLR